MSYQSVEAGGDENAAESERVSQALRHAGPRVAVLPGLVSLVLNVSINVRHGKKMPGVSSNFDLTMNRHVMGQQALTLGLCRAAGFVPLDSELFISATRAQALHPPFQDRRNVVAKRYRVAQQQTKPQMAKSKIRRVQRAGMLPTSRKIQLARVRGAWISYSHNVN
jgi:hypothetical protein